jgi:hypothetical protein
MVPHMHIHRSPGDRLAEPGYEPRDNPVVRQAPPGRVNTGEERQHATDDPSLLMPGDTFR